MPLLPPPLLLLLLRPNYMDLFYSLHVKSAPDKKGAKLEIRGADVAAPPDLLEHPDIARNCANMPSGSLCCHCIPEETMVTVVKVSTFIQMNLPARS